MDGVNWYLKALRNGIRPMNEANTSRYVHEVLFRCLQWPFDSILPQASKRGFIDYELELQNPPTFLHVEVKPFGAALKAEHIYKYLVKKGPASEIRVGVLTNLQRWEIFIAGQSVKEFTGTRMARVKEIEIKGQADVRYLDQLIGYRGNGGLRHLRAALGESDAVLQHLVCSDAHVVKALRRALADLRDKHSLDASVPQHAAMTGYLSQLLAISRNGVPGPIDDLPFTQAKLRQAVWSQQVAEAANARIVRQFRSRNRVGTVRSAIRRLFRKP